MRGKKSDVEFVSSFIAECANQNLCSPWQIAEEAERKIRDIDQQIKEIELKKVLRSKLLDVTNLFKNKKIKPDESKVLPLFEIKNHHICKHICNLIKDKPSEVHSIISGLKYDSKDVLFCIKQLMEYKVISKTGDYFLRGNKFDEYSSVVLKEV